MQISHRCRNRHWPHRGSRQGWRAPLVRAAWGAVFAAALVCAATGAARAGDDDNNNNQTMSSPKSLYDRMLQVIGVDGGSNIQYSERSPLVVPPTRELPMPLPDRAPAVADWPTDPDLTHVAHGKPKEKRGPVPNHAVMDALPLRPDQLDVPGGHTRTANSGGPNGASGADYPEQQGRSKRSIFSLFSSAFKTEEYGTFTGEPSRTSLTDPPPGYLTPSPDQPYGVGPEEKKTKVPTVADRVTPVSGTRASQ
jgi:hypothetical protein